MKTSTPLYSTSWLIFEKLIFIALSFVVTLALARHLMPALFGELNYLMALVALVSPLMAVGLNSIITREVLQRPSDNDVIMGSGLALRFFAGLLVLPIAIALGYVYLESDQRHFFAFLIVCSLSNTALLIDFWLQAHLANRYAAIVRLITLIVFSVARLSAVWVDSGLSVFVYLVGLEFVFVALLYLLVYHRFGAGLGKLRVSVPECNRLWSDSRWLFVSSIAAVIYLKMDQIMLGILVDDRAVGIYAAAARISEVWYFIPVAIVTSFFPPLINAKSSDTSLYQNDLQRLNDLLFVSALVIAFGVSLTAGWGIEKLFGITYAEAASVLIVHTWVGIFVFMRVLLSKWFITENLLKLSMFSQVLGAFANMFLNAQLIPLYGPIGAAYATVISFSVAGYLVLFLHRDLWPMALVVTRSLLLPLRLLQKGRNLYSS